MSFTIEPAIIRFECTWCGARAEISFTPEFVLCAGSFAPRVWRLPIPSGWEDLSDTRIDNQDFEVTPAIICFECSKKRNAAIRQVYEETKAAKRTSD